MFNQLREKDAQIHVLQKKLQHFRSWVSSIHHKVQQMNPQAIKNSKRLYIGGIPADTTEASASPTADSASGGTPT
jgi:hypothetical protein